MILVEIHFDKNWKINKINCVGHANNNHAESEVLCACVTSILTGGCNTIDQLNSNSAQIICQKGECSIELKQAGLSLQLVLQTIYWQLKTLQEQYPKHFKWKETNDEI